MSDPTPTPDDMTVVDTKITTVFIVQRELPSYPGLWRFWVQKDTKVEAEVACNSYAAAYPERNFRVRRAFDILTRVVEN